MSFEPVQTILVDFDGTISSVDVGNALFRLATKGEFQDAVSAWKAGDISSRECLIAECSLARISRQEVLAFALDQPMDPSFKDFLNEALDRDVHVRVVSDGLDFYIKAILKREGLGDLPVESNRALFTGDRLLPAFPFAGRGCGRCGNCKAGAVASARSQGRVGFIGDGLSDRCGAKAADWVLAKRGRDLVTICQEESIAHQGFDSFADVIMALEWA